MTVTSAPAAASRSIRRRRAVGDGVPGSTAAAMAGSSIARDSETCTGTWREAACSRGTSRASRVPLVSTENGVPESARARMIPGISA